MQVAAATNLTLVNYAIGGATSGCGPGCSRSNMQEAASTSPVLCYHAQLQTSRASCMHARHAQPAAWARPADMLPLPMTCCSNSTVDVLTGLC